MAFPEIDFLAFKEECLSIRSEVSRRRLGHEFVGRTARDDIVVAFL